MFFSKVAYSLDRDTGARAGSFGRLSQVKENLPDPSH